MNASKEENSKRLRYIRLLGRFISGIISWLSKAQSPTKEQYDQKVDMNFRFLEKNEAVKLYKDEYTELEALGQKILDFRASENDIETIKEELFYAQNQLEKRINARRYKKSKHDNHTTDGW
ncbi:hypothetical protein Sulku_0402 [Sulfuricurvum kujiense DSM 16994]|uniref:Uncharacterized protein n=1 Tax=Sulfuricurvum kujiense (strain ATCC BAA-921 / DSM 16994 / JCM 11577 / YK-1) TaxID=709032 RepID=E4TZI1_SULKY|nr:hypothetical protein [Sulfuricurvum kujiense]ADR33069.1 hypothetical protein Sulku_0402 [Sulfuricurvum kujiense DSM 16994]